jgi:hypothetical protein
MFRHYRPSAGWPKMSVCVHSYMVMETSASYNPLFRVSVFNSILLYFFQRISVTSKSLTRHNKCNPLRLLPSEILYPVTTDHYARTYTGLRCSWFESFTSLNCYICQIRSCSYTLFCASSQGYFLSPHMHPTQQYKLGSSGLSRHATLYMLLCSPSVSWGPVRPKHVVQLTLA